jgi:hypothetical protein
VRNLLLHAVILLPALRRFAPPDRFSPVIEMNG